MFGDDHSRCLRRHKVFTVSQTTCHQRFPKPRRCSCIVRYDVTLQRCVHLIIVTSFCCPQKYEELNFCWQYPRVVSCKLTFRNIIYFCFMHPRLYFTNDKKYYGHFWHRWPSKLLSFFPPLSNPHDCLGVAYEMHRSLETTVRDLQSVPFNIVFSN